jgi:predicted acyltransferase
VAEPRRLPPAVPAPRAVTERLVSIDAYRGLVMVLMISAGLRIHQVVEGFDANPEWRHLKTPLWERLAYQADHAPWAGCTLWDLIQSSFMFLVGSALIFSVAKRRARGDSFARMFGHALVRAFVLVFLGVFLSSSRLGTEWTFVNVLAQIGLGYPFLFLLAWARPRWQVASVVAILVLYWGAFALYPAPPADLNPTSVGLPADWPRLSGFASHWEKNTNVAARADQWFLNRFPRTDGKPFVYNEGGYQTLNFVPSLATMVLGLLAGELLRNPKHSAGRRLGILLAAGVGGLAMGWALDALGVCPIVKRIWTPSWAIFSAGWSFLALAFFYVVIDLGRLRAWAFPLVVVGMNSIAIYCVSMLMKPWVHERFVRHFGSKPLNVFGAPYEPMMRAGFFLLFCWLVCWWMYRQKIFIKI